MDSKFEGKLVFLSVSYAVITVFGSALFAFQTTTTVGEICDLNKNSIHFFSIFEICNIPGSCSVRKPCWNDQK